MAYASGDIILDDHYNTFATGNANGTANHAVANINTVWGVGSGAKGYGQTTTLTPVTAGVDTVTATQWSTMIARLNSILTHQSGSGSGLTSPTAGDIITYISALSGKVTDAYNNSATFQTRQAASTTTQDGSWTNEAATFTQVRTVTFASADQMRYFFNAGGRISLGLTTVSGSDNGKESAWTSLLNSGIGAVTLDFTSSSRTGTGYTLTTNGSAIGFWDLTTSDQTLIKLTETSTAYTSNYVEVLCKVSGSAGTNGGLGTNIVFTINYVDGAADAGFNDGISMTVRTNTGILKPSVTNLTDVWGTISVGATSN